MHTALMISLYDVPHCQDTLKAVAPYCDHAVIRVDNKCCLDKLDIAVFCADLFETAVVYPSDLTWNRWNWREEMLRKLDHVAPDLVLCPDEDERFGVTLQDDIDAFMASDRNAMMFSYHTPMPTDDGRVLFDGRPYPGMPHMKAFKWSKGLTYRPYQGFARVTNYAAPGMHYHAKTKIWHYCCYTQEMRDKHEMKW